MVFGLHLSGPPSCCGSSHILIFNNNTVPTKLSIQSIFNFQGFVDHLYRQEIFLFLYQNNDSIIFLLDDDERRPIRSSIYTSIVIVLLRSRIKKTAINIKRVIFLGRELQWVCGPHIDELKKNIKK